LANISTKWRILKTICERANLQILWTKGFYSIAFLHTALRGAINLAVTSYNNWTGTLLPSIIN